MDISYDQVMEGIPLDEIPYGAFFILCPPKEYSSGCEYLYLCIYDKGSRKFLKLDKDICEVSDLSGDYRGWIVPVGIRCSFPDQRGG